MTKTSLPGHPKPGGFKTETNLQRNYQDLFHSMSFNNSYLIIFTKTDIPLHLNFQYSLEKLDVKKTLYFSSSSPMTMQNSPHRIFITVLSSLVLNVTTDGVDPFPWDIITKPNNIYFQEVLFSVQSEFSLTQHNPVKSCKTF